MKRSASYIKKNKIRLKNGEAAAQKVERCRQEFASRQMNRAQQGSKAPEESLTDNTFTDLEPASLQVNCGVLNADGLGLFNQTYFWNQSADQIKLSWPASLLCR